MKWETTTPFDTDKRYASADKKNMKDLLSVMMKANDWNQKISFSGIQLLKEKKK